LAVAELDCPCTANMVSNVTGRSRAKESTILNQLVFMGFLNVKQKSYTKYFSYITEGNVSGNKGS